MDESFFDLTKDLIDALEEIQDERDICLIKNSNNQKSDIDKHNAHDKNDSSIDFLDEVNMLFQEHLELNEALRRDQVIEVNAHPTESDDEIHPAKHDDEIEQDLLTIAAQKRIERDKERRHNQHSHHHKSQVTFKNKKLHQVKEKKENQDEEGEMYTFFDNFRKDFKLFVKKHKSNASKEAVDKELSAFLDEIEAAYRLKVDEFGDNDNTINKVSRFFELFLHRCREGQADLDKLSKILFPAASRKKVLCKFKYWTCKVCGKGDLFFDEKRCSVCGRLKKHLPLSQKDQVLKMKDPVIEEEQFLASGDSSKEEPPGDVKEGRIRRQYLYSLENYDMDTRIKLKNEVEEMLGSVRRTISRHL